MNNKLNVSMCAKSMSHIEVQRRSRFSVTGNVLWLKSLLLVMTLWVGSMDVGWGQVTCGINNFQNYLLSTDPDFQYNIDYNEQVISNFTIPNNFTGNAGNAGTCVIPVVVHVIHLGSNHVTNISTNQINSAIDDLNEKFANLNGQGVDVGIQFCLASRDPLGNASNGVTRTQGWGTYLTDGINSVNEPEIKLTTGWPSTNYYNIWIVSEIDNNDGGNGTQGYAYFPGAPSHLDGAVIMHNAFGTEGSVKPITNQNNTLVHEVAHSFFVYHTFNGDCPGNDDICNQGTGLICPPTNHLGDRCNDTPRHARTLFTCIPTGTNNCTTPPSSNDNVIHNYMDYSSEICKNRFTNDQSTRMRNTLMTVRSSLLISLGCMDPCDDVVADFNAPLTQINVGQTLTFTNTSTGATTFQWFFQNTPAVTTQDYTRTFDQGGTFQICLNAMNGPDCVNQKCQTITVLPFCTHPQNICELVENGDFEQVTPFENNNLDPGEVCGWRSASSSPFYTNNVPSRAIGLLTNNGNKESVRTIEGLNLQAGIEYLISFDYLVCNDPLYRLTLRLQSQDNTIQQNIVQITDENLLLPTEMGIQNNADYPPNAQFRHFEGVFTATNANILHIIPARLGGSIITFIDNVSIITDDCSDPTLCSPIPDFTSVINGCNVNFFGTNGNNQGTGFSWNFGDGTNVMGQNVSHLFNQNGTYNVCLTIPCADGLGTTICRDIVIVNCISSCIDALPHEYIRLHAANGTLLSTFINAGSIDPPIFNNVVDLTGYMFAVTGKLIMDLTVKMNNTHFIFGPGAELVVYTNGTSIQSSTFRGCDILWKGITAISLTTPSPGQPYLPIIFDNNFVYDAKYGLNIMSKGVVRCTRSTFDNNVIGINAEGAAGFGAFFWGNKFLNTSTGLMPPYAGFELGTLISPVNRCYAGIRLNGVPRASFFGLTNAKNIFEGIKNGIVAFNSEFAVSNAQFKNLLGAYRLGNLVSGYGIFGRECTFANIYSNSFETMYKAVVLDGSVGSVNTIVKSYNVSNNTLKNINFDIAESAIDLSNCAKGTYDIVDNSFDNVAYPIRAKKLITFSSLYINNNGLETPMIFNGTGIAVDECVNGGDYARVENNRMKSTVTSTGIRINATDKVSVRGNDINIIRTTSIGRGIILNNSKDHEVRNNVITFTGVEPTHDILGISSNLAPNTLYCCNTITGAKDNVFFQGSSGMTRFKQNTMDLAIVSGLRLNGSAVIGLQFYFDANDEPTGAYGNIWKGNKNAINDGAIAPSLFHIHKFQTLLPSEGTWEPVANKVDWFLKTDMPVSTPICSINPDCNELDYQGEGFCGTAQGITFMEDGLDGLNTVPAYESQATWSHQTFVYDYLERHPQVATNSVILSNFVNNPPSAVYTYHQIESKIATLYNLTSAELSNWNAATQSKHVSDSILTSIFNVITPSNAASYSSSILAHQVNLVYQDSLMDVIQTNVIARAITKANQIKNLINQMPVMYPFLAEYKTIRSAYIDGVIYDKAYVSSTYANAINNTADKCIGQYGRSVEWARDLQRNLGLAVSVGEGNCPPITTPRSKSAPLLNIEYTVSPNPSNGEWNLEFENIDAVSIILIEIKDVNGKVLVRRNETLEEGEKLIKVSGGHLPNGLYYLSAKVNDVNTVTKKLVKIE